MEQNGDILNGNETKRNKKMEAEKKRPTFRGFLVYSTFFLVDHIIIIFCTVPISLEGWHVINIHKEWHRNGFPANEIVIGSILQCVDHAILKVSSLTRVEY